MTQFSLADHQFMQRAIHLASKGHYTTSPNPRVGCVLVNQGKVVGEGYHIQAGAGHAEVNALVMAGDLAKGATAYVTLEPCSHFGRTPPCAQALIDAQVSHVIAAMVDPNPKVSGRGLTLLNQAGITSQTGLLETQARELNIGFITLMTTGLPYVRCKMASSLDGKTAMASGESQWITGSHSRQDVQRLRAQSCAIITGADTVIIDNAKMTVRKDQLSTRIYPQSAVDIRQPARIIIDSQSRITPELAIFNQASPVILVRAVIDTKHQWPSHVEQLPMAVMKTTTSRGKIDLHALLICLAKRGFNDVLVEAGSRLAGAFFERQLVDELILYQAPKLMGAQGKSLLAMPSIESLACARALTIKDVTMVGADLRIVATTNKTANESD